MKYKKTILKIQKNEITDHLVYRKLAGIIKNKEHSRILSKMSADELRHYNLFKTLSNKEIMPDKGKIFWFVLISRTLGLNFGLKLMESAEGIAQEEYSRLKSISPDVEAVIRDEEEHEKQIINMIDEDSLKYVSSMILGLNDALVELTGALAGFTLALQNTHLVGVVGLITGLAGSMSMASSEYLSTKHEDTGKDPLKASIYTGIAYVGTVLLLVAPFFILKGIFLALALTILTALTIMALFNFYVSVAKELSFKKRFLEMAGLSLGIAVISFLIGLGARKVFGVEV